MRPGIESFAETALQHAHHRFDLPALTVATAFGWSSKVSSHLSPVSRRWRLFGWSSNRGRDDGTDAVFASRVQMNPLGVIAGIGQGRVDVASFAGFAEHLLEMQMIGPRSAARHGRKNEMSATIRQQADLRKTAVRHAWDAFVAA